MSAKQNQGTVRCPGRWKSVVAFVVGFSQGGAV